MGAGNFITCGFCGAQFSVYRSRAGRAKYCSVKCKDSARSEFFVSDRADRFWSKVDVGNADGCWNWLGYKQHQGYGKFGVDRKIVRAHRFAYELTNGPIADGMLIRHKCDNPSCCNPAHLESGTHAENSADMAYRGRGGRGPEKSRKIREKKLGVPRSEETKRRLSEAAKGKPSGRRVAVIVDGIRYASFTHAGRALGCSDSLVRKWVAQGKAFRCDS